MPIGNERPARIKLEAPSGKLEQDLRQAQEKLRKFQDRAKKRRGKDTTGKLLGAARVGVGALEKAGASLFDRFSSGVGDAIDLERGLTRFQLAGDIGTESMFKFRTELTKVASATGIARTELLDGAASYLALTGDADGARNSVELFAQVANASGAAMADVSNTAASLRENLKIDPKDFEAAFSALIVQGKAGAIELKDLAQVMSTVAPQFSAFDKGGGLGGLATMGAALQAGRKGFSSASEAATGFQNLMTAINRNAKKFTGVKIFERDAKTGDKKLRSFLDIVDGIANSKLAKDPTLLTKAFGSSEAKRFYDQLVLNRGLLTDLEEKSRNGGVVAADALAYQQSAAGQLEQSMEKLKIAIASAFTPDLIKKFSSALESVAKAAKVIADVIVGISEFNDVRKTKNRNEKELAKLGEYTGNDSALRFESRLAARRIELEGARTRVESERARAKSLLDSVGAGALQLRPVSPQTTQDPVQTQSRIAPAPLSLSTNRAPTTSPLLQSTSAPPINIALKLDGDTIAKSQQNARAARRSLGGR